MKIGKQEVELFGERLANLHRKTRIVFIGSLSEAQPHLRRFFAWRRARISRAAMASPAVA